MQSSLDAPPMPTYGLVEYRHDPLPSTNCIRLLVNLEHIDDVSDIPEGNTGPSPPRLRFSLHTVDLDSSPEYDCLSYTWVDPFTVWESQEQAKASQEFFKHREPVICDGKVLWLGRDLCGYLAQSLLAKDNSIFSNMNGGRPMSSAIWIDAVCIDQTNLDERAQQVSIMQRIYGNAETVIVWFGERDTYLRPAMMILNVLGRLSEDAADRVHDFDPLYHALGKLVGSDDEQLKVNFDNVYPLMHRAWFRRAWVIQEAVLAKRLLFTAGTLVVPVDRMHRSVRFLLRSGWWPRIVEGFTNKRQFGMSPWLLRIMGPERFESMLPPGYVLPVQSQYQGSFDPLDTILEIMTLRERLYEILTKFRGLDATNPRDKVYAFLGLLDAEEIPSGLEPDYTDANPWPALYTRTVQMLIAAGHLAILGHKESRRDHENSCLPSWVPDLRTNSSLPRAILVDFSASGWDASGSTAPIEVTFGTGRTDLKLQGWCIDEVHMTASWRNSLLDVGEMLWSVPVCYNCPEELPFPKPNFEARAGRAIGKSNTERHSDEHAPRFKQLFERFVIGEDEILSKGTYPDHHDTDEASQSPSREGSESPPPKLDSIGVAAALDKYLYTRIRGLQISPVSDPRSVDDGPKWDPDSSIKDHVHDAPVQTRLEALWRTLVADTGDDGQHPAPETYGVDFVASLCEELHDLETERIFNHGDDASKADLFVRYQESLVVRALFSNSEPGEPITIEVEKKQSDKQAASSRETSDQGAFEALTEKTSSQRSSRVKPSALMQKLRKRLHKTTDHRDIHTAEADPSSSSIQTTPETKVSKYLPDMEMLLTALEKRNRATPSAVVQGFRKRMREVTDHRKLFTTKQNQYFGLGLDCCEPGDQVWILKGANVPILLRKRGDGTYTLVGEAYVHGIMYGEAIVGREQEPQNITLR